MPIKSELRKFYRGPWRLVRKRILARAGGTFDERGVYQLDAKCEVCKVPDRITIVRYDGLQGWWVTLNGEVHRPNGELEEVVPLSEMPADECHVVRVVLTCAHLNRVAGDDREENLAMLCQRCHNRYDARDRAAHAKQTRIRRKDERRPLFQEESHAA